MFVTASAARASARMCLVLPLVLVALAACPQVIRDPAPTPPREGCSQGASTCYGGVPWVCGTDGQWSPADRRCDLLGARCCLAESTYHRRVHACVPTAVCLDETTDGGAQ